MRFSVLIRIKNRIGKRQSCIGCKVKRIAFAAVSSQYDFVTSICAEQIGFDARGQSIAIDFIDDRSRCSCR